MISKDKTNLDMPAARPAAAPAPAQTSLKDLGNGLIVPGAGGTFNHLKDLVLHVRNRFVPEVAGGTGAASVAAVRSVANTPEMLATSLKDPVLAEFISKIGNPSLKGLSMPVAPSSLAQTAGLALANPAETAVNGAGNLAKNAASGVGATVAKSSSPLVGVLKAMVSAVAAVVPLGGNFLIGIPGVNQIPVVARLAKERSKSRLA